MADEPFVQYSPGKIATAFDLEHGLHDAFKHREEREMSGGGDSEGAEKWLDEANGQEDDSGDSDDDVDNPPSAMNGTSSTRAHSLGRRQRSKKHKKLGPNQKRRKKQRAKESKNKKRRLAREEQDAYDHKPPLSAENKLQEVKIIECNISAEEFQRAKGAWIGRSKVAKGSRDKEIEDLLAAGLRLIEWDGIKPMVGLDKSGRVVVIFAGSPEDPTWKANVVPGVEAALKNAEGQLDFDGCQVLPVPPGGSKVNRRGNFSVAATGVSFGGGQKEPGNLRHTPENEKVLQEFLENHDVRRAMKYGNNAFAYFAPWSYAYYVEILSQLFYKEPRLQRICKGSVFPAISLNFGPQAVSSQHKDHANLADGLCWIMSCGQFNPKLGGHLILWELGLVVEFPPGSSVLIPSAVITHENVPIQEEETRMSITQYAAGGLFRWVEYGFQTEKNLEKRDPRRFKKMMGERADRWRESIKRFSHLESLEDDRRNAFYDTAA